MGPVRMRCILARCASVSGKQNNCFSLTLPFLVWRSFVRCLLVVCCVRFFRHRPCGVRPCSAQRYLSIRQVASIIRTTLCMRHEPYYAMYSRSLSTSTSLWAVSYMLALCVLWQEKTDER